MESKITAFQQRFGIGIAIFLALGPACSTAQVEPPSEIPPEPPPYVQVPHPLGLDGGDLHAIFQQKDSPSAESMKNCDSDFFILRERTNSKEELDEGIKQLVRRNPVKYHWCFYTRIMQLDESLKAHTYIDERQKDVIRAYLFIAPVGRAFFSQFSDSRYLRWAISRYRTLSEVVFFRKVELSPHLTAELVGASNPYGFVKSSGEDLSVLEKYGLSTAPEVSRGLAAVPAPSPSPISELPPAGH